MIYRRFFRVTVVLAAFAVMAGGTSSAAKATVGREGGEPGDTQRAIPITLTLGAGEKVGGVQFDLAFDNATLSLREVSAGPAATAASKDLFSTAVSPGRFRVIIAGLNQNAIQDGVIANASFDIAADAASGEQPVSITGVVLSDPYGEKVPVDAFAGSIRVGGGDAAAPPMPLPDTPVGGRFGVGTVRYSTGVMAALALLGVAAGMWILSGARASRVKPKRRKH